MYVCGCVWVYVENISMGVWMCLSLSAQVSMCVCRYIHMSRRGLWGCIDVQICVCIWMYLHG